MKITVDITGMSEDGVRNVAQALSKAGFRDPQPRSESDESAIVLFHDEKNDTTLNNARQLIEAHGGKILDISADQHPDATQSQQSRGQGQQ